MNPAYRTVQEDVRELMESAAHDSIQSNEDEAAQTGSQTQRSHGTSRRPQFLSPNSPDEEKWKLRQLQLKKSIRDQDLSKLTTGWAPNRHSLVTSPHDRIDINICKDPSQRYKLRASTQRQKVRLQLRIPNDPYGRAKREVDLDHTAQRTNKRQSSANSMSKNSFTTQRKDLPSRSEQEMTPLIRGTVDARKRGKDGFSNRKVSHQIEVD